MKKSFLFLVFLAMVCLTNCQKDELLNSNNPEFEGSNINVHLKSAIIETEPNNTPQSACGPVYSGDTFSGTIESYGANDFIRFIHSGGPVAFSLTGTIQYQNLGLVDGNNNYIGESWTISPNQYLVFNDLSAGTYYIRVSGYGGNYTVQINPPFSPGVKTYFRILREYSDGNYAHLAYQYVFGYSNFWGGIEEPIRMSPSVFIASMHPYYPWYQETQNSYFDIVRTGDASNGYPRFNLSFATPSN